MHFNEMSVKSRQLGLAFVAAALGVAVVLLGQGKAFELPVLILGWTLHLHVAPLIMLTAASAVWAVRRLDIGVYHMMLRGAVTFGEDLEARHLRKLIGGEKGMTEAISHFSRYGDAKVILDENGYNYTGVKKRNALDKLKSFYSWVIYSSIIASIITGYIYHNSHSELNLQSTRIIENNEKQN
jgi:hypothetical protein